MEKEDELARLAREEILRETQRASARADEVGPQGWMKCPVPPANKRFLHNTLLSTLPNMTLDSAASHRTTKSESSHHDKNEHKPEPDKNKRKKKRTHSKDSYSKSPKSAKVERHIPTRTKSDHGDTRKTQ